MERARVEKKRSGELAYDLGQMLESGDLSDFTVVVGGEELKVHKFILFSRSPVFQAMFQHDMKEKKEGRLEIEDLDVVGVKGLMQFLYTGVVEGLSGIAEKVLPAADKYGVEKLKAKCEEELCKMKLDVINVTEILVMADLYEVKQLKAKALEWIRVNSEEVVKLAGFWELNESNRELFKEAVAAIAKKEQKRGRFGELRNFRVHAVDPDNRGIRARDGWVDLPNMELPVGDGLEWDQGPLYD